MKTLNINIAIKLIKGFKFEIIKEASISHFLTPRIKDFCSKHKIQYKDMIRDNRTIFITRIRHILMYKFYEEGYSTLIIGKAFNKDHSTVSYAIKKIRDCKNIKNSDNQTLDLYNKLLA